MDRIKLYSYTKDLVGDWLYVKKWGEITERVYWKYEK